MVRMAGRPPLPPGEIRKRYTITFRSDVLKEIGQKAQADNMPMSRYIERALLEYMRRNP